MLSNATERVAFANRVTFTLDHLFDHTRLLMFIHFHPLFLSSLVLRVIYAFRYDAGIRPNYDGPPTEVEVNLAIR